MTDYFEHIKAYKNGKLTGDLLTSFEAELVSNSELKAAVENHDVVEEVFDLMWEDEIRRVMKEGEGTDVKKLNSEKQENKKNSSFRPWMSFAAGLAALIAIGFLMKNQMQSLSGPKIYAKHYSPFIDSNITRGEQGTPINLSQCKLGHFYLEEGDFNAAQEIFEKDLAAGPSECTERSQWYLCLYNVRFENLEQRDQLLNAILENPDHDYYEKALKLQADLD